MSIQYYTTKNRYSWTYRTTLDRQKKFDISEFRINRTCMWRCQNDV